MKLKFLVLLLSCLFRPHAEPPADDPSDTDDPPPPAPSADDDIEEVVVDAAPPADDELTTSRRERDEARQESERYQRELAELRAQQHRPVVDAQTQAEDAKLKDPNTSELEKWQINANRELRTGRSMAQAALMQANDVNDRTAYSSLCISNPLAKKYETRVEQAIVGMRKNGQNASREAVFKYLLGEDMVAGKFKKKSATPPADTKRAPRGATPGARSDVPGRGAPQSEKDKRRARLENQQI